jgi:hypothetical protein
LIRIFDLISEILEILNRLQMCMDISSSTVICVLCYSLPFLGRVCGVESHCLHLSFVYLDAMVL